LIVRRLTTLLATHVGKTYGDYRVPIGAPPKVLPIKVHTAEEMIAGAAVSDEQRECLRNVFLSDKAITRLTIVSPRGVSIDSLVEEEIVRAIACVCVCVREAATLIVMGACE
jgi:hypothetical protein